MAFLMMDILLVPCVLRLILTLDPVDLTHRVFEVLNRMDPDAPSVIFSWDPVDLGFLESFFCLICDL